MRPGPLIILSGPSGSGKTTLIAQLLQSPEWPLRLSISATTRARRPMEVDGIHYHFWPREQFLQVRDQEDGFLEWAEVFGNFYGTLRREVDPFRQQGVGVLLDIDVQGWKQVKAKIPEAVSIFVRTSTIAELEARLRRRHTESESSIARRLREASAELAHAERYDHQVVNDQLEEASNSLRSILDPLYR